MLLNGCRYASSMGFKGPGPKTARSGTIVAGRDEKETRCFCTLTFVACVSPLLQRGFLFWTCFGPSSGQFDITSLYVQLKNLQLKSAGKYARYNWPLEVQLTTRGSKTCSKENTQRKNAEKLPHKEETAIAKEWGEAADRYKIYLRIWWGGCFCSCPHAPPVCLWVRQTLQKPCKCPELSSSRKPASISTSFCNFSLVKE